MFKQKFAEEASKHLTGVVIGEGPCDGEINIVKPNYNVFGLCVEFSCKCE